MCNCTHHSVRSYSIGTFSSMAKQMSKTRFSVCVHTRALLHAFNTQNARHADFIQLALVNDSVLQYYWYFNEACKKIGWNSASSYVCFSNLLLPVTSTNVKWIFLEILTVKYVTNYFVNRVNFENIILQEFTVNINVTNFKL